MKTLVALLLMVVALAVIAPLIGAVLAVALPLGWLLIWLLPIVIIACSDKTTGGEKLAWILAIVFLSWFAWIFYFLLAPIKKRRDDAYLAGYRGTRDRHGYRYE
jgi:hypothetical protein